MSSVTYVLELMDMNYDLTLFQDVVLFALKSFSVSEQETVFTFFVLTVFSIVFLSKQIVSHHLIKLY